MLTDSKSGQWARDHGRDHSRRADVDAEDADAAEALLRGAHAHLRKTRRAAQVEADTLKPLSGR